MNNWQSVLVDMNASIRDVIAVIDQGAIGAAFVVDKALSLLGTVTDGDVRRSILCNTPMSDSVSGIMNKQPRYARVGDTREQMLSLMQNHKLHHLPIVDEQHKMVGLTLFDEFIKREKRDNWVVIMAGGQGTRLRPLTNECPKPLLKIESKPVLQIILEGLIDCGFHNFIFSLNYRGDMIRNYFAQGQQWGVNIQYIEEHQPLGTAGALGLIEQAVQQPFMVMNGDIMTRINYGHLLDFHFQQQSFATVCVREYQQTIPYGVVKVDEQNLLALEEKPVQHFFVNAGIYVFDEHVLSLIAKNKKLDMPDLITQLSQKPYKISVFPIREYWTDIGRMEDFQRAHHDYREFFV